MIYGRSGKTSREDNPCFNGMLRDARSPDSGRLIQVVYPGRVILAV